MFLQGLRKARHMVKEGASRREIRKFLFTLKKKNIFSGLNEPLNRIDVNNILYCKDVI